MIEMNMYNIVLISALISLIISLPFMKLLNKHDKTETLYWGVGEWVMCTVVSIIWPLGMLLVLILTLMEYGTDIKIWLLKKRSCAWPVTYIIKNIIIGITITLVVAVVLYSIVTIFYLYGAHR